MNPKITLSNIVKTKVFIKMILGNLKFMDTEETKSLKVQLTQMELPTTFEEYKKKRAEEMGYGYALDFFSYSVWPELCLKKVDGLPNELDEQGKQDVMQHLEKFYDENNEKLQTIKTKLGQKT